MWWLLIVQVCTAKYIAMVGVPFMEGASSLRGIGEVLTQRGYQVDMFMRMDTLLFAREEQSLEYMLLNIQLEQDWIKSTLESAFQKLPPDLVVLDRFAYAGFEVCSKMNIPVVVNNAAFLMDMDQPGWSLPAPNSFLSTMEGQNVLVKAKNVYDRIKFRIAILNCGMPRVDFLKVVVMNNAVFGMELPRILPANFVMVGPVWKAEVDDVDAMVQQFLHKRDVVYVKLSPNLMLPEMMMLRLVRGILDCEMRVMWVQHELQAKLFTDPLWQDSRIAVISSKNQRGILKSGNVQLFIMTGSLQEAQMAIRYNVPLLVMPNTFSDVVLAQRLLSLHAGTILPMESFHDASIQNIIRDTRILNATLAYRQLQRALVDSDGLKEAADLVCTIAEYGADHLLGHKYRSNWFIENDVDLFILFFLFAQSMYMVFRKVRFRKAKKGINFKKVN